MQKKPLKIYLADLTYDTIAVSTNSIPLNIGFIASYCIQRFSSNIEVVLFKYVNELEQAINNSPPDILGLSNYCWNQNLGYEMSCLLHENNPQALSVWGGPNFPNERYLQEEWLNKYSDIDIYIPLEGEVGWESLIDVVLKIKNRKQIRSEIRNNLIFGCINRKPDSSINFTPPAPRIKDVSEIPSPYLTGLLDKFFDDKLDPLIQVSRGCPFKCTFCVDGSDDLKIVNRFDTDRASKEIEYIAKRVPKNIETLQIVNLNFGMHREDLKICDAIMKIKKKYNYPNMIQTAPGKNSKERIIAALKKLEGTLILAISVQSMDKQVLKNIKRENISEEKMVELLPTIKESGLQTKAEVILGLPGDSVKAHLYTLKCLLNTEIDEILVFSCMLLPGSELYSKEEREKWGIKAKHRIIPRDFTKLSNGKVVLETEEVVVETENMKFDEYVDLRVFNFLLRVTTTDKVYSPLKKFLKQNNIKIFDLVEKMFQDVNSAPQKIKDICNKYKQATIDELWDSSEEIIDNYQKESEYKKLINGEAGINVLFHHQSLVMISCMTEWTEFVFSTLNNLLIKQKEFNNDLKIQFEDVSKYTHGTSFNPLGSDRLHTNPRYKFNYDIFSWLNNNQELPLSNFKLSLTKEVDFILTNKQYKIIQNRLNQFEDNIVSVTKALFSGTIIPSHLFWRNPSINNQILEKENYNTSNQSSQ